MWVRRSSGDPAAPGTRGPGSPNWRRPGGHGDAGAAAVFHDPHQVLPVPGVQHRRRAAARGDAPAQPEQVQHALAAGRGQSLQGRRSGRSPVPAGPPVPAAGRAVQPGARGARRFQAGPAAAAGNPSSVMPEGLLQHPEKARIGMLELVRSPPLEQGPPGTPGGGRSVVRPAGLWPYLAGHAGALAIAAVPAAPLRPVVQDLPDLRRAAAPGAAGCAGAPSGTAPGTGRFRGPGACRPGRAGPCAATASAMVPCRPVPAAVITAAPSPAASKVSPPQSGRPKMSAVIWQISSDWEAPPATPIRSAPDPAGPLDPLQAVPEGEAQPLDEGPVDVAPAVAFAQADHGALGPGVLAGWGPSAAWSSAHGRRPASPPAAGPAAPRPGRPSPGLLPLRAANSRRNQLIIQ